MPQIRDHSHACLRYVQQLFAWKSNTRRILMCLQSICVNPTGKQLICPIPIGSPISPNLSFSLHVPETWELLICNWKSFIFLILLQRMCLMPPVSVDPPQEGAFPFLLKRSSLFFPHFFPKSRSHPWSLFPGVPCPQLFSQEAVALPVSFFCFLLWNSELGICLNLRC